MSGYHLAILLAAIVTGFASYRQPRALVWIGALAASFTVSVTYLYMPKPYWPGMWWPPASGVAMLCDAAVCVALYVFSRERWEAILYGIVLTSVAVNFFYTAGSVAGFPPIPPHEVYAIVLEALNYLALLLIGGTGIMTQIEARNGLSFLDRIGVHLRWLVEALRSEARLSAPLRKR
jgi:hypothetical protein